jgi:rhomboid protease GluP
MNGRRLRKGTPATLFLLGAILIAFGIEMAKGAANDSAALYDLGAIASWSYLRANGEYWRLITAMFLHGGVVHLALNVFSLWQVGSLYEVMFGTRRFVFIYFLAGIAASTTSMLQQPLDRVSVGASGAIFGIVGAFVTSVLRSPVWRRERSARSLVVQCVLLVAANIMVGMRIEQIDNAAHIGGLVAGLLLGALLPQQRLPPPSPQRVIDVQPYEG